jgi:hypothetical protein
MPNNLWHTWTVTGTNVGHLASVCVAIVALLLASVTLWIVLRRRMAIRTQMSVRQFASSNGFTFVGAPPSAMALGLQVPAIGSGSFGKMEDVAIGSWKGQPMVVATLVWRPGGMQKRTVRSRVIILHSKRNFYHTVVWGSNASSSKRSIRANYREASVPPPEAACSIATQGPVADNAVSQLWASERMSSLYNSEVGPSFIETKGEAITMMWDAPRGLTDDLTEFVAAAASIGAAAGDPSWSLPSLAPQAPQAFSCPNCGAPVSADEVVCHFCGMALRTPPAPAPKIPGAFSGAPVKTSIVVGVCLIVCAVLFYFGNVSAEPGHINSASTASCGPQCYTYQEISVQFISVTYGPTVRNLPQNYNDPSGPQVVDGMPLAVAHFKVSNNTGSSNVLPGYFYMTDATGTTYPSYTNVGGGGGTCSGFFQPPANSVNQAMAVCFPVSNMRAEHNLAITWNPQYLGGPTVTFFVPNQ